MSNDPIQAKHREKMLALARVLGEEFDGYGFTLLVFDFGDKGRMNYVSNARREDVLAAMQEFIAKNTH